MTSKARNKIRVVLKDRESHVAELGKELLQRRLKNRKLEVDEGRMSKVAKKMGYKTLTDFNMAIGSETLDVNDVIEALSNFDKKNVEEGEKVSASEFVLQQTDADDKNDSNSDVLVIGNNIKGLNYRLAKCCNPIFGDDVFGFVSSEGVVKYPSHRLSQCGEYT